MANCDTCIHNKTYHTGMDEYPPCTNIPYCEKGHWENGWGPDENPERDCNDYTLLADIAKAGVK